MSDTPSSGTDIASLDIVVNAGQPLQAADAMDKMKASADGSIDSLDHLAAASATSATSVAEVATTTTRAVKSFDELAVSSGNSTRTLVTANDVMNTANAVLKNRIQLLQEAWKAEQAVIAEEEKAIAIVQAETDAQQNFIIKLKEQVAAFNLTNEALIRHKADLLGIAPAAEQYIVQMEQMRAATQQYGVTITEVSQIEAARAAWEESNMTALNAQRVRMMAENRAAAIVDIDEMEAARVEAQERETARITVFEAFKRRTMAENRAAAVALMEEQEVEAARIAEKQAIAEIYWSSMSVKSRIAELEKLRAYQANPAISQGTISSTFSQAAMSDLPNLTRLQEEYAASLEKTSSAHGKTKKSSDELGISFDNNRARTEALVLAHEALQGRFTRMPGSLMVLAEYTNAASLAFTGMGIATLAGVAALIGFMYEIGKGSLELVNFNRSMTLTGGMAGQTRESIEQMAEELKVNAHGAIGTTTDMLNELVKSGKFSAETLRAVGQTALEFQMLTGQSTDQVAKYFEGLGQTHGKVFNDMTNHIADWAAKSNDQYHFLSAAQYEHIRVLSLEGESSKAIVEIMHDMDTGFDKQGTRVGVLVELYRGFVFMLQSTAHWLQEVGKDWFHGSSKEDEMLVETKKYENLIKLRMEAKNGRKPNSVTGDPGLAASPTEVAALDAAVKIQHQKMVEASNAYNQERLDAQKKGDLAVANQEGVEGQRHLDYLRKVNMTQKEIADDQVAHLMNSAMAVNKSNMMAWEANYTGAKENMMRDEELAIRNGEIKVETAQTLAHDIEDIYKKHHDRVTKAADDGRYQTLLEEREGYTAAYKLAEQAQTNNEKLLTDAHKAGVLTDAAYYETLRLGRNEELSSLKVNHEAKIQALENYTSRSDTEKKKILKQIAEENAAYEHSKAGVEGKTAVSNSEEELLKQKKLHDTIEDIIKVGEKEVAGLDRVIAAQIRHNVEIGKTKTLKEEALAVLSQENVADDEQYAAYLRNLLASQEWDEASKAAFTARLVELEKIIAKHDELNRLLREGAALEAQAAIDKAFTKLSGTIETDIESAIVDGGGRGARKLIHDMEMMFAKAVLQPILAPISQGFASIFYPDAAAATNPASGAIGAVNAAKNAYNSVTGGFEKLGGYVSSGVDSAMGQFGPGTIGSTGPSAAAGYAGTAAQYGAGLYAGHALGNLVAGKYQVGNHGEAITNTATVVGAIFGGPIGAAIGGTIGGLFNRAFGMGPDQIKAQGLRGNISDSGVSGNSYANHHEDGGWFRSDKNWTDNTALGSDVINSFSSGLASIKSISTDFAKSLGVSGDALKNYSKDFDITLGTDANANQEAVTKFFTTMGDDMATKLVPNISSFSKSGETASQTLERLSNVFKATDQIAAMLGKDTAAAFGSIGLSSDAARERLVNLAGGADKLSALTSTYAQNYETDAEKIAPLQTAVAKAMAEMGYAGVTTKDQLKAVVSSLDLNTESGAQAYVNLMQVQDAFAQVADYADKAAKAILDERKNLQDQLNQLILTPTQLLAMQRDQLSETNRGLFDQLQAAKAAKDAQDAQKTSLTDLIGKMKSFTDSMKALHDGLLVGSLSTLTPEQQYFELKRQYEKTVAAAKNGDTTAQGKVDSSMNSFLTASQKIHGGDEQYTKDFQAALQTSDDLAKWSASQESDAQKNLDALNDVNQSVLAVLKSINALPGALTSTSGTVTAPPPTPVVAYNPLTKVVDNLNIQMAAMGASLLKLREEQAKQTADLIDANNRAIQAGAKTTVKGFKDASVDAAWVNDGPKVEIA